MNGQSQGFFKDMTDDLPLKRMDKKTRMWYIGLLIVTLAIFVIGIALDQIDEVIVSIPIIVVLAIMLFHDKEVIHVPPALIFLVVLTMYIALAAHLIKSTGFLEDALNIITYVLIGIVLGTIGIITAYMSLGKMPGFLNERPALIAIESYAVGVALYSLWMMAVYFIYNITNGEAPIAPTSIDKMMVNMFIVSFGCFIVSIAFFLDKRSGVFKHAIVGFLGKNSDTIGIEDDEKKVVLDMIKTGESDTLEFKSTLRTNLQTGERDKRMERAVLKTIVAFLNSNGGSLLVGVADDGEIIGMDMQSFDNRDKLNLHITNMLSAQIGDEYIPFIRFKLVDFDEKAVIVFTCTPTSSPVFLKDGKEEIFFVRSGPSSVELTGMDLIKYAENRNKMKRKKKYAAAAPLMPQQQK